MLQTKFIASLDEFFRMMSDPTLEITSIIETSKTKIQISYRKQDDYAQPHAAYNPIICAFVTSAARKVLLTYLNRLGKKALYCDTGQSFFIG